MRFVLNELHQDDGFGGLPCMRNLPRLTDAVLEEAAALARMCCCLSTAGDAEGAAMKMAWSPPPRASGSL
jgi:hypothetical protein